MIFTREPIIETILSPKDGCKLCIRNSKIPGAEELLVDAVEVVSFGSAFFFRGQERPKPFLVPVSDYEIFEVKETRVVLKNITHERNIKIAGGREAFPKRTVDPLPEKSEEGDKEPVQKSPDLAFDSKHDKKRDRRRNRRKRISEAGRDGSDRTPPLSEPGEGADAGSSSEVKVTSAMFSHLLPPPPTLISETLGRLREKEAAEANRAVSEDAGLMTAVSSDQEGKEVPKDEDFFN